MSLATEPAAAAPETVDLLSTLKAGLKPLASLQLTVVLFALSLVLVFFGTVAQIDNGIWTVVDQYFWSWMVMIPFELLAKMGHVFFFVPKDFHLGGHFPFPAGKFLALTLCVNIVAAHLLRFKFTWNRSGIMILHSGLLLLLAGEVITREAAIEQQMLIDEGGASNYAYDTRNGELVFLPSPLTPDSKIVGIPQSRLIPGAVIRDDHLPVDVVVKEVYRNSKLSKITPENKENNPATAGFGLLWKADKQKEVSGVDNEQKHDIPAAYIELRKKGTTESLGTYLISLQIGSMDQSDPVTVGDATFDMTLRPTRYYKPFTVQLIDFRFDKYVGTRKAKNYSSLVKLIDPELGVNEEITISMNNPLRHRGETFYQHSFDEANESYTVLQVVRNPGWVLPYASCVVVSLGMFIHFGITLFGFLKKRNQRIANQAALESAPTLTGMRKWLPWLAPLAVLIAFLGVGGRAMKVPGDGYDLDGFSKLPVADGGRIKPIDTVARVYLRLMSGSEELKDPDGRPEPAVKWLLDVIAAGTVKTRGAAWEYKTFYIENEHVLGLLGLEPRSGFKYSLSEIEPKWEPFAQAAEKADAKKEKERTQDERKLLEARKKIEYFLAFNQGTAPQMLAIDIAKDEWKSSAELRRELARAEFTALLVREGLTEADLRKLPDDKADLLQTKLMDAVQEKLKAQPSNAAWEKITSAYKLKDPSRFNEAVAEYREHLATMGYSATDVSLEIILNRVQPLYYVIGFYVFAGLLVLLSFMSEGWAEPLRKASFNVLLLTVLLHTAGLILRMVIQGRPPVTNLYSSAVYIGWGCALLGCFLERLYRNGVGIVIGSVLGFGASLIAHNLLGSGEDTLEMMQAVLDTNFWLATHVTCITFGYVATYVAAKAGIIYLIAVIFMRGTTVNRAKDFARMMYGIICFATLLSFVGTVLGGIWADQSWGRFWGWDPKENGAILLVIWNALILHARWAGLVKDRGIAVLAVLGGCITTWSWFGTNQLSVGLHAYGFSSELARLCLGVWVALSIVAVVGLAVPRTRWASQLREPSAK